MNTKQEELMHKVLQMDNTKYYLIEDGAGLVDDFKIPLLGELWKLLLYKEIKAYVSKEEYV